MNFYEDAVNILGYDSRQGGYLGTTFTTNEIIQEFIELEAYPFVIIEDIVYSIDDIPWVETDYYYENKNDRMQNAWTYFSEIVTHKTRFLFETKNDKDQNAFRILKDVGSLISSLNIIRVIPAGSILFRCRHHSKAAEVKDFDDITAPHNIEAIYPNRFSPAGIAMFYGSFDQETAKLETISREDPDKDLISTGSFRFKEDIYTIDLQKLPKLPSIFGVKNKERYHLKCFLHYFINEISKKIKKDGKEHIEYVPTQVVTEFLRYPFNKRRKNKISGLIYPSSQNDSKASAVFFWDKEKSRETVQLIDLKQEVLSTDV